MKGDFSRDTFSPRKHYSAVLMQQGRVQLDADWNEQQTINQHRTETEARNLIGLSGAPADNAGFEISVQDNTLRIGSGEYYVDGILCENDNPILFGNQDDLPGMDITSILSPSGEENGVGLVYLDVWEQHLTAVEDDRIREVALGGPDTTTRKRTVCQVKARRVNDADTKSNISDLQSLLKQHRDLAKKQAVAHWGFDEDGGAVAYDSSDNGNDGMLEGPSRTAGKIGTGALRFISANKDVVRLASNESMEDFANNFTVAFWANPQRTIAPDKEQTSGTSGTSGQRYALEPRWREEKHAGAGVSVGTNGVGVYEHANGYMPALLVHQAAVSGWTHIAVIYENRRPKLYLNGVLAKTGQQSQKDFVHVNPETLGGMVYGYFHGQLDDVRVYDRPLDALEVAALAAPAGELHELRTQLQRVKDQILELVKVDRHQSSGDELNAIHRPSTGELLVDTNGSPSTGGYELLENQLYRVEIHKGGEPGVATFKWSRDNGSVVTPVLRIPNAKTGDSTTTEIAVRDLGNDETLGFAPGQYVELMSDDRELNGQAGPILRIVDVSPAKRTITVGAKLDPIKDDDARAFHYKLRRWDYPPDQEMTLDGIKILPNEEPVDLEGGIRVRFSAGRYSTGDYWLIPARTATGDVEWPRNEFRPPAGIEHHYSPLALAMLGTFTTQGGGSEKHLLVLSDCRHLFTPLTGMTGLFYLGGDGQSALPLHELPGPLVVGVAAGGRPVQGARVKFEVQGKDLASYNGHLAVDSTATEEGGGVKSLIVTTDARGEAKCFWTLAKEMPNQQVKVSLVDGTHLPVYFNANLSVVGETAVDIVQIDKVLLGTQELGIDTAVPATALADSAIKIICSTDMLSPKFRGRSDCYVTLEMPFPQNAADKQLWGNDLIGFQPLVLAAGVNIDENEIEWTPSAVTRTWLKNKLYSNVQVPDDQILARLTLKGNFAFPSGGDGRAGDFEMPFRVVEDQVRLNPMALDRLTVIGQTSSVKGTVNLVGAAPSGGVQINLRSSNASVASVPSSPVTIDAGKTSNTFEVNTTAVAAATTVEITATTQDQQQAVSAKLVVQPPVLESLGVNPLTLTGKSSAGGTVTLTGPAPAGGASVALSSGSPAIVNVPSSVNVAAGSRTNATPFTIETEPVNSVSPVAIAASYNGNRQTTLTVEPPVLITLALTAPSATGGTSQVSGRVILNAPAPAGYTVALRSTDASAATVPENISVPQNATSSEDFSVTTKPVASRSDLNIVATRGGVEKSAPLTVQPPTLTNFEFVPPRIPNAGSSTGKIDLSGPAPSNTVANLAASNDATVTLPTTVPVTAGANQLTFQASGRAFTGPERSVTVTAFYLGATRPANLTVEGAKAKDTKEKEKDIKEKERISDKIIKEFEEFEDKPRDNFLPRSVESTEPGVEESASERSFIRPEERPEPGQHVTEESDEEE